MIKINLLAEGKRPVVARKSQAGAGGGSSVADARQPGCSWAASCSALLAGAGLLVHACTQRDQAEGRRDRGRAEGGRRAARRSSRKSRSTRAKKAELEHKIDVINHAEGQPARAGADHGPGLARAARAALARPTWTSAATTINLRGTAFNMSAVANFIDNLDKVPEFQRADPDRHRPSKARSTASRSTSASNCPRRPLLRGGTGRAPLRGPRQARCRRAVRRCLCSRRTAARRGGE